MPKILDALGFVANPFATYVAENEPDIDQYFVRPPYYSAVTDRGRSANSLILFGARGAGKSATRLAFFKESWKAVEEGVEGTPLVVTLDDYSRITDGGIVRADLSRFVGELGYRVVEAVLVWLAALDEPERQLILETLTRDEEASVIAVVERFYLSRAEFVRSATVREPLKLLGQAWHKRAASWGRQRRDSLATLVSVIAQAVVKKATDTDVALEAGVGELLKAEPRTWSDSRFAREILARLVSFAEVFGFAGVTILVDKVDETDLTSNSAELTATLLYPVLSNTQLLEIEGFGWLFFLWDEVRGPYTSGPLMVRLDKIANARIQWEDGFLRNLVSERLRHFSNRKISQFAALCDSSVSSDAMLEEILRLSMRSPRELIRILDTIVREHDDEHAHKENVVLLQASTIERGLDKYTTEALPRIFKRTYLQQIARLGRATFINKDVQGAFRVNDQSARNRIRAWSDAGLVVHAGSRPAEGGSGGKPAHEYAVVDQRARRMLERGLSLGADFELFEDDPSDEIDSSTP